MRFFRGGELLLGKINCAFEVQRGPLRVLFKKLTRDLCATLRRSPECHGSFYGFSAAVVRTCRVQGRRARFLTDRR